MRRSRQKKARERIEKIKEDAEDKEDADDTKDAKDAEDSDAKDTKDAKDENLRGNIEGRRKSDPLIIQTLSFQFRKIKSYSLVFDDENPFFPAF